MASTSSTAKYEAIPVVEKYDSTTTSSKYDDLETASAVVTLVNEDFHKSTTMLKRRKAAASKARWTCCGVCGCISCSVLSILILLLIVTMIVGYSFMAYYVRMVTVDTPVVFPIVTISDRELQEYTQSVTGFVNAILEHEKNPKHEAIVIDDLVLPARIVNGIMSQSDYLRGHVQFIMKKDECIIKTSLPMDMLPGGSHRFFVSTMDETYVYKPDEADRTSIVIQSGTFDLGKKVTRDYDGPLMLYEIMESFRPSQNEWMENIRSLTLLGQDMEITPEVQNMNLLQSLYDNTGNDPNIAALQIVLNGIEGVRIETDRMIIHARQPSSIPVFSSKPITTKATTAAAAVSSLDSLTMVNYNTQSDDAVLLKDKQTEVEAMNVGTDDIFDDDDVNVLVSQNEGD